jgi:hypothetical protein
LLVVLLLVFQAKEKLNIHVKKIRHQAQHCGERVLGLVASFHG